MTQELEKSAADYRDIVAQAVKSGSLSSLLTALDEETSAKVVVKKPTKQDKIDRWKKNKDEMDLDEVQKVDDVMKSYVTKFFLDRVDMPEPRELTQDEVDKLAEEYVEALEMMTEVVKSRSEFIRQMVFDSLTQTALRSSDASGLVIDVPAQQVKGRLVSEKYGVAFCKEGGKRKDPDLDWRMLESLLTKEQFAEVCDAVIVPEVTIPAHVEYTPKPEKLMDALNRGKIDLEVVRKVLTPGAWASPRFAIRKI